VREEGRVCTCARCGAALDVPEGAVPRISIESQSGKPNVYVLTLDGTEIHRCPVTSWTPCPGSPPSVREASRPG